MIQGDLIAVQKSEIEKLRAVNAELLEALQAVAPYFEGEHAFDHPHCVQLRAAIAKAIGEEHGSDPA